MGLKGLKRQVRNVAVGAASFGMLVTGVVVTAPSAVAQDPTQRLGQMPDVKGERACRRRVDSVSETAGPGNITFKSTTP